MGLKESWKQRLIANKPDFVTLNSKDKSGGSSIFQKSYQTYWEKESLTLLKVQQTKEERDHEKYKRFIFLLNKKEIQVHVEHELRKIRWERATQEARADWWQKEYMFLNQILTIKYLYEIKWNAWLKWVWMYLTGYKLYLKFRWKKRRFG